MKQKDHDFFTGGGEHRPSNIQAKETFGVSAGGVPSFVQMAADRECQHPQQSRPLLHEPFEPYGMN